MDSVFENYKAPDMKSETPRLPPRPGSGRIQATLPYSISPNIKDSAAALQAAFLFQNQHSSHRVLPMEDTCTLLEFGLEDQIAAWKKARLFCSTRAPTCSSYAKPDRRCSDSRGGGSPEYIQLYAIVASTAVHKPAFDGVEICGANGYLLDQFLHGPVTSRLV
ncbi:hypothetical protein B0H11DRAFT_712470 [Mycena galericulata]|nr:hypothetical protein B0H11DRAFT_712470 [Mycena galericulata]